MTIGQRERIDRRYRRAAAVARFIRDHVSRAAGRRLLDAVTDRWAATF